ncbi:MAG TPA: hypothetical protein VHB79_00945 [Polyangiaceae bacterium]|nr:hypothetical protein [Polyangiaceae bacterium]
MTSLGRGLVRAAAALSAVAVLGTALIGFAHTPWGRPLLGLPLFSALARRAGCPVGAIGPAAFERVRATKLRGEVGKEAAGAHPALGFTLGLSQRQEVERWAQSVAVSCRPGFVESVLECEDVKVQGSLPIAQLRLQFDGNNRLVGVDLFRSQAAAEALVSAFAASGRELDAQVGPATSSVGTASVADATASPFKTVLRKYSYRDYVATLTLVNLGKRGLRLREQYGFVSPPA